MKTILPFALLLCTPAMAATLDTTALDRRIANALGAGIGEPGGAAAPVDPQLRLAACPQAVTIDPPAAGALAVRCPALGWRIRVPLKRFGGMAQPGSPQTGYVQAGYAPQAKPDPVIRRGDPVDLVAGTNGFSVSVAAIAQEDGAPGARIRVKTDGGKPQNSIMIAEVVGPGEVRVPGFN